MSQVVATAIARETNETVVEARSRIWLCDSEVPTPPPPFSPLPTHPFLGPPPPPPPGPPLSLRADAAELP